MLDRHSAERRRRISLKMAHVSDLMLYLASISAAKFFADHDLLINPTNQFEPMDPTKPKPSHAFPSSLPIISQGPWSGRRYLPLEFMRRLQAWPLFCAGGEARRFRSSGTTAAARSVSRFSSHGLAAYKAQSVTSFLDMLAQVLPQSDSESPLVQTHGISLVPTVEAWPESSLAQMVAWIGEVLPLTYSDDNGLAAAINGQGSHKPIWLFATAFHLINAIDSGHAKPLPDGSVIIETGGTKGKSRELSRTELYRDLSAAFGIPEASIISEYGMCELACQAYDFLPQGHVLPLEERRFRFPDSVKLAVITAPGCSATVGRGALTVHDPFRLDAPWPVRTEDLAELHGQTFRLIGRAPTQPLKGCSLQAEELSALPQVTVGQPSSGPMRQSIVTPDPEQIKRRAAPLAIAMQTFASGPDARRLLRLELGSDAAAVAALQDLLEGLPLSLQDWMDAAQVATQGAPAPRHWLFILPANHSMVGLYPLALGYLLGLQITVRLPHRFAAADHLITAFIALIQALPGAAVTLAAPSLRLGGGLAAIPCDALLAYGSDETMAQLRLQAEAPLQGFGGRVGISMIASSDLTAGGPLLARDLLSLGQSGCMATRLIVMIDDQNRAATDIAELLAACCQDFWAAPIPWSDVVALDFEAVRLAESGAFIIPPQHPGRPLVAMHQVPAGFELDDQLIESMIARTPFTVTILSLAQMDGQTGLMRVVDYLSRCRSLGTITTSLAVRQEYKLPPLLQSGCQILDLGTANRPFWSGCHENKPLFVVESARVP